MSYPAWLRVESDRDYDDRPCVTLSNGRDVEWLTPEGARALAADLVAYAVECEEKQP